MKARYFEGDLKVFLGLYLFSCFSSLVTIALDFIWSVVGDIWVELVGVGRVIGSICSFLGFSIF